MPYSPTASNRGLVQTASRDDTRRGWLGVVLALTLWPATAFSQDSQEKALAESLFEDGRQLMEAKRYEEACPKLAESQKIDPGGGTLLNLAICYEKQGKTASAWASFKEALGVARKDGRADRATFAEQEIRSLEPKLSKLTVVVPQASRVPGLQIERDGSPLSLGGWDSALAVDPGTHVISATAQGYQRWETRVEIRANADVQSVRVPALLPAAAFPAGPQAPPLGTQEPAAPSSNGAPSGQLIAGLVVGGVGAAISVVGLVVGGLAIGKRSESDEKCGGEFELCPNTPDGIEAVALNDDAQTLATVSNVLTFGGLGIAAIGVVIAITAPSGPPNAQTARLRLRPLGVALEGTF